MSMALFCSLSFARSHTHTCLDHQSFCLPVQTKDESPNEHIKSNKFFSLLLSLSLHIHILDLNDIPLDYTSHRHLFFFSIFLSVTTKTALFYTRLFLLPISFDTILERSDQMSTRSTSITISLDTKFEFKSFVFSFEVINLYPLTYFVQSFEPISFRIVVKRQASYSLER